MTATHAERPVGLWILAIVALLPGAPGRGARTPLIDRGETVGAVLRTRAGVQPLYVSIGHRISLTSACDWVLACSPHYRLPETTRHAHQAAAAPARAH